MFVLSFGAVLLKATLTDKKRTKNTNLFLWHAIDDAICSDFQHDLVGKIVNRRSDGRVTDISAGTGKQSGGRN
jgi:hypothetical protein